MSVCASLCVRAYTCLCCFFKITIQEISKKKGKVKQSRPLREGELAGGEAIGWHSPSTGR